MEKLLNRGLNFCVAPLKLNLTEVLVNWQKFEQKLAEEGYLFIYLFTWRESKGTFKSDGKRGDKIKASVNGYTFYISIMEVMKKVISLIEFYRQSLVK